MIQPLFMQRCLQLATLGLGHVAPNPMVGCILVCDNKIIAEGYHQQYGKAHAEVNAIANAPQNFDASKTTLYVNLEPCAHFGKTPPCAQLIINSGIKNVVIATTDPFAAVNGKGIKMLTEVGVNVTTGVLQNEALFLNRRFVTFNTKNRPYVILKWAMTADGFIARNKNSLQYELPDQISNAYAQRLSHLWRMQESAIAVGFKTAMYDNPKLNVRYHQGKNPLRIVIDKQLQIPAAYHILSDNAPTVIFNNQKETTVNNLSYQKIKTQPWYDVLSYLYKNQLQSVIIEGGAATHQWFIDNNLWDEARIVVSNNKMKEGLKAPILLAKANTKLDLKDNKVYTYYNHTTN
ncbi:MAG TPA: bifunctional diaminohydroxyphosphoribosylaminopyrimidine deaminase/5-amino-6-(5-phosphoribosylamino)uracil reductase RibD [Bacteroidia bacterium]|nr:bifunctional diaminohydroxyphosphoribosylaminopyrimidine deaminase/5-amino-6-(5-phosphoribosylamino)uracil reductase RibD [Bacteroidia bacterium]